MRVICQCYSCLFVSLFLQLGVELCSSPTSFCQMACVFLSQQIFSSDMCVRASMGMVYHSWIVCGKEESVEHLVLLLCLYQGDVICQYLSFGNTAVLLTSTWACFHLGGADTADHVAAWPSGYSLVWRGCGIGRTLWTVACDPILVGKQNGYSCSYPVFRAYEADGPSR